VKKRSLCLSSHTWRSLWIAAIALGGTFQLIAPVLANGTAAGTSISNTANVNYEDPSNPGVTINSTSNTVTVTVAEISGLTVTPSATTDVNGGTVLPNDVINYDFLVTNVGNDPTAFVIPGVATLTGPGTAGTLQISTDGGQTYSPIPSAGFTTGAIPAGGSVRVRVPVTVDALAPSGAPIKVVLGNTGANDNSVGTQNQAYPTNPTGNDLHTQDNANGTPGESAGTPANGEREASASQSLLVGSQPQAFAAVLKTHGNYDSNSTPTTLSDDKLTYNLSLRVDSTAPNGSTGLTPANLIGTTLQVNGSPVSRILISDAIPTGTHLNSVPTAPAGWTVVYTTDSVSIPATNAAWSTTPPALNAVTRVGFIRSGTIAAGTTVTGFSFQVITDGITGTTTIANMAQLFGQTENGGSTLVYDESGDSNPSNVNDNGTPGSNTPTTGVANPALDGLDNTNDNAGTGPGGEVNVFTIAPPNTVLNGTSGHPDAVGPTNNNDDFSNRSVPVAANQTPGSKIDPVALTFTNTLNNPSAAAINNILLVPTAPAIPGDLPTGTTVTLSFNGNTAVYTYNGTNFTFTSGSAIQIPTLTPGVAVNYTTSIDLPANTALSTDTGKGYPVPIRAFIDSNVSGTFDPGESYNDTIDRIYTGFLKSTKEVRVLDSQGNQLVPFGTGPITGVSIAQGNMLEYRITYTNITTAPVGAGNLILNAVNTAIVEDGTAAPNNWSLDQDGNGAIDTSNVIGSAMVSAGTVSFFSGNPATTPIPDQTGITVSTDVTKYINKITTAIPPQGTGTFIFRRRIN
jgi:hypothetical protein